MLFEKLQIKKFKFLLKYVKFKFSILNTTLKTQKGNGLTQFIVKSQKFRCQTLKKVT